MEEEIKKTPKPRKPRAPKALKVVEEIAPNLEISSEFGEVAPKVAEQIEEVTEQVEEVVPEVEEVTEEVAPKVAEQVGENLAATDCSVCNKKFVEVRKLNPYLPDGKSKWVAQIPTAFGRHILFKGSFAKTYRAAENWALGRGLSRDAIKRISK